MNINAIEFLCDFSLFSFYLRIFENWNCVVIGLCCSECIKFSNVLDYTQFAESVPDVELFNNNEFANDKNINFNFYSDHLLSATLHRAFSIHMRECKQINLWCPEFTCIRIPWKWLNLIKIYFVWNIAAPEEEASQQESCTSPISCEKSWAEEGCQSIVRKTPKELRHWYVSFAMHQDDNLHRFVSKRGNFQ